MRQPLNWLPPIARSSTRRFASADVDCCLRASETDSGFRRLILQGLPPLPRDGGRGASPPAGGLFGTLPALFARCAVATGA